MFDPVKLSSLIAPIAGIAARFLLGCLTTASFSFAASAALACASFMISAIPSFGALPPSDLDFFEFESFEDADN
jgi:hypothetical protein